MTARVHSVTPLRTVTVRHHCNWTNLAGHAVTGRHKTNVRIPTSRIVDHRALCEIMTQVGAGGRP